MTAAETAVLAAYVAVLAALAGLGWHRWFLVRLWWRTRDRAPRPAARFDDGDMPAVTVQLPIYNEIYVVERLIDAACALRHPRDRFEVQVLDDSTDATVQVAAAAVSRWRARGVDVVHVRRTDRTGFKAGALEHGAALAKGELLAVFDADFVPGPGFLADTVHHFTDPGVGMVQARWDHLNRECSGLTEAQAVLLDGHFVIEHAARNRSGRFFNFNGTAGVWRKAAIADAGGWQHDTLTEDLDLSYRAQLAGWRFVFLADVLAPGEVPPDMGSFKSQQHRWAKGAVQTARKLLPRLLRADLPVAVKAEAVVHLTGNVAHPLMVCLSALMPLSMFIRPEHGWRQFALLDLPLFAAATASVCAFYGLSQRVARPGVPAWRRWARIPLALAVGVGLSFNQARAIFEALRGDRSPFVRTPKFALTGRGQAWRANRYLPARRVQAQAVLECATGLLYAWPIWAAAAQGRYACLPFLGLFMFGYLYVGATSLNLRLRPARGNATLPVGGLAGRTR